MTTRAVSARRELGALIKAARRDHRIDGKPMSQAELARLLGCTQGKIQKIEAGAVKIEHEDVDQIIKHLDIDEAAASEMHSLVSSNTATSPWSGERALVPNYARRYLELEQIATEILSWHDMRIPGPLQSELYMLRQFNATEVVDPAPYLRNHAKRRELFRQPQLRRYQCILAEEALHRAASGLGRDVARDQVNHLLTINNSSDPSNLADARTSIHILPIDAPIEYIPIDFSILRLAEHTDSVVYIEHVGGGQYLHSTNAAQRAFDAWTKIAHIALDKDDTSTLLAKLHVEFANPD